MPTQSETLAEIYSKMNLDELKKVHEHHLTHNDAANAALVKTAISRYGQTQTADLVNCGQLFKHSRTDPETGRVIHEFTGDIGAFLGPFTNGGNGIGFRFNPKPGAAENSPYARAARAFSD